MLQIIQYTTNTNRELFDVKVLAIRIFAAPNEERTGRRLSLSVPFPLLDCLPSYRRVASWSSGDRSRVPRYLALTCTVLHSKRPHKAYQCRKSFEESTKRLGCEHKEPQKYEIIESSRETKLWQNTKKVQLYFFLNYSEFLSSTFQLLR